MHLSIRSGGGTRRAFTLVELLVVVAIIIVLAALVFTISGRMMAAAQSTECMNRLRQTGAIMIGSASDNHNRIRIFKGGSGSFDYRPYFILRDEMDLPDSSYEAHYGTLSKIMFCPAAPEPKTPHWNCFGLNFTNSEIAGVTWRTESVKDAQGRSANVSSLSLGSVSSPSEFLLVGDSCRADGQQIFRISGSDLVGLRHRDKANALFLDGSVRALDRAELGQIGFKHAYDTSTDPPTKVALPRTQ